jgi:3-deoxy-7-phosphoheptulonate synthase
MKYQTDNLRIDDIREVSTPAEVRAEYPITETAATAVHDARQAIHNIRSACCRCGSGWRTIC